MRSLTEWSAAPAKDVETAVSPKVNVLRGLVARATTPLWPDDYLKLLNPLWSRGNCVGWWSMSAKKLKTRRR
jgi:stearoyl-CoA 9-desaturase NADPH oxidoreductase